LRASTRLRMSRFAFTSLILINESRKGGIKERGVEERGFLGKGAYGQGVKMRDHTATMIGINSIKPLSLFHCIFSKILKSASSKHM